MNRSHLHRILLFFLLMTITTLYGQDSLLQFANRTFPGYAVEIKECSYTDLNTIVSQLQKEQPSARSLQKRIEQALLGIQELKQSFVPQLSFGINHQRIDFRERMVSVYTKVPVEWDNENPEQIDVNLPNGGHGLLWMPKPTKYDWRYIDVHASRPYEGNSAGLNAGLHYEYHSGITLDLLSLRLNKRFSPETYGYDWYSTLDNTVSIPLLKIFNSNLSPRETETKNLKNTIENLKLSVELNRAQEKKRLLALMFKLYLSWERHYFFKQMIELTREQIAEVQALSDKKHLTVSEEIAIGNELQGYISTENIIYYEILSCASALKSDDSSLIIYKFQEMDIEKEVADLEHRTSDLLDLNNFDNVLSSSPQLKIMENNLKSAKANFALLGKRGKIHLDLVGNVSLLSSSDLGFKTPQEATKMIFTNPDGLNSSVGLQFTMPLSFQESDYGYKAALKEYQIAAEDLQASKTELKRTFQEIRINLLNLKENVRVAKANLQYADSRLKVSSEFYHLKRVSAYEFNSYRKERLRCEFAVKESQVNYYTALADFWSMMNMNTLSVTGK